MEKSFLNNYNNLSKQYKNPDNLLSAQASLVRDWLSNRPKEMFDELRQVQPIFKSPRAVIVTRHPDVLEVLQRDTDFSEMLYTERMKRVHAHFFLGMPDSSEYQREVSIMRLAANRDDLTNIKLFIEEQVEDILGNVRSRGHLDVVRDLSRVVPTRFVGSYLGVTGPDENVMKRWMRDLFWDLFRNLANEDVVVDAANQAAKGLKQHLVNIIAKRKASLAAHESTPDDVLTRLLNMQSISEFSLSDDGIRRNITGLAVGAVETTSECVVNVLDVLLDRPEMLKAAQVAALEDEKALEGYVFEALRFKPQHPFLYRVCVKDCTIARGTPRETSISKGSLVFAAVWSAMFDEQVIEDSMKFKPDRMSGDYLLFGAGRHTCFGNHINRVQISALCRGALRMKGLRRAAGANGRLKYEGPFPDQLVLEFDS